MNALSYRTGQLPIGEIFLAASERGLILLEFGADEERSKNRLERQLGVPAIGRVASLERAWRQLNRYCERRQRKFDLPVDTALATPFQRRVLHALARISYGSTETYSGLAARVGRRRAQRAVGQALNKNPLPIVLPCHRVIGSDGGLVGYRGGLGLKRRLLRLEGVIPDENATSFNRSLTPDR